MAVDETKVGVEEQETYVWAAIDVKSVEIGHVEAWFFVFEYRTMVFFDRFPYRSTWQSADRWAKAFATFHNALRYR